MVFFFQVFLKYSQSLKNACERIQNLIKLQEGNNKIYALVHDYLFKKRTSRNFLKFVVF